MEDNYINIVKELNQMVFDEGEDDASLCLFEYRTNGSSHIIQWNDLTVFDSEESDRGWDKAEEEHLRTIIEQVRQELHDVCGEIAIALKMMNDKLC